MLGDISSISYSKNPRVNKDMMMMMMMQDFAQTRSHQNPVIYWPDYVCEFWCDFSRTLLQCFTRKAATSNRTCKPASILVRYHCSFSEKSRNLHQASDMLKTHAAINCAEISAC